MFIQRVSKLFFILRFHIYYYFRKKIMNIKSIFWRRGQDSNLQARKGGSFQDYCITNYATPPRRDILAQNQPDALVYWATLFGAYLSTGFTRMGIRFAPVPDRVFFCQAAAVLVWRRRETRIRMAQTVQAQDRGWNDSCRRIDRDESRRRRRAL